MKSEPGGGLRLAYIPGPGAVSQSYRHWLAGRDDPDIPIRAYSSMFYDVCRELGAQALVIERGERSETLVSDERMTIVSIPAPAVSGRFAYWRAKAAYSAAMVKKIRQFRPHVVVLGGDFFWPMLPLLKKDGARIVISVHNTYWPMGTSRAPHKRVLDAALGYILRRNADSAVVVSEECARQFRALAGSGAELFLARPQISEDHLRLPPSGPQDQRNILYVGRLERDKGIYDLLEAFEMFAPATDASLVFVGDGSEYEAVSARAAASPYASRIIIKGRLDGEGVHLAMRDADLLVCPTRPQFTEGFATVCAEALAHGVPSVVSTAVPAAELLGDACRVAPAGDYAALARTVEDALADLPALREAALTRRRLLSDEATSWGAGLLAAIGAIMATTGSPPLAAPTRT